MTRDLNKVMIIGRLGADPEMRYTAQGTPITQMRVAVNRRARSGDAEHREETDWFTVITWERLAEMCAQYLRKGSRAYFEGRLQTRSWEGQDGQRQYRTEIVANEMILLDSRRTGETGGDDTTQSRGQPTSRGPAGVEEIDIDEMPF